MEMVKPGRMVSYNFVLSLDLGSGQTETIVTTSSHKKRGRRMPIRATTHFGLDQKRFENLGAFDSFLDDDSDFYLDPALLFKTSEPEFLNAKDLVIQRFVDIFDLLKATEKPRGTEVTWFTAVRKFQFREISGVNLGYSDGHTRGRGIGRTLSSDTLLTVHELVKKGVDNPRLFELVPVFQDNIGCDRISDMLCSILKDNLANYTRRVFTECGKPLKENRLPNNPFRPGTPVYILPKSLLSDLPLAESWWDIGRVCAQNEEARSAMSRILGSAWVKADVKKHHVRALFVEHPDLVKSLIEEYEKQTPKTYDFDHDPKGEFLWVAPFQKAIDSAALSLTLPSDPSLADVKTCIAKICDHFKELVENKGSWEVLYQDDRRTPRKERVAQRAFRMVADSYCRSNDLDISPESNAGAGPVDFKFSRGLKKVCIEVKLSSNPKLIHSYEKQLPAYEGAENSIDGIMLVIDFGNADVRVNALIERETKDRNANIRGPTVIIVDARPKQSGSRI